ncbi:MAG: MSMEG_4193 family putative phosphomutase [Micrococcales bacterium]|nr:MSMEG_4193 family putative phosphomutase [Micrococcales bacterium]
MPTCVLVRHGHSSANASGVLAGWTPGVHLDERGRAQVADVARRLAPIRLARIVSSPLDRCQETATAIAEAQGEGETFGTDGRLGECHYGAWTGRALTELATEPLWSVVQSQPSAAAFPASQEYAAESIPEMAHRAVAAIRELDAQVASEHGERAVWAAVSHGDVIKAVLADAAGAHLDHFQRFEVGPASVSVVRHTSARPFVLVVNDRGGDLGHLVPPAAPTGQADVGGTPD